VRILLTGALGLIGRHLQPLLRAAGHQVVPLVRAGSAKPQAGGVLFDPAAPDVPAIEAFDAVIHLAGENVARRWTPARKASILASRADFTTALMTALSKTTSPPKHILSASAIGYYGHHTPAPVTESSPSGDGFLAHVCREWESAATKPFQQTASAHCQAPGFIPASAAPPPRLALLRLGVVLTPEGGALAKMLPPFRYGLGGTLGSGHQLMSWISLPDVLAAILHVLETPGLTGPINLATPHPVTNRQFTKALAKHLHRPALLPVPAFALKAALGQMARETILAHQHVLPAKLLASTFTFRHPTIDAALHDLLPNT
jgi:uncharacterized protein (TIGR01777 family)